MRYDRSAIVTSSVHSTESLAHASVAHSPFRFGAAAPTTRQTEGGRRGYRDLLRVRRPLLQMRIEFLTAQLIPDGHSVARLPRGQDLVGHALIGKEHHEAPAEGLHVDGSCSRGLTTWLRGGAGAAVVVQRGVAVDAQETPRRGRPVRVEVEERGQNATVVVGVVDVADVVRAIPGVARHLCDRQGKRGWFTVRTAVGASPTGVRGSAIASTMNRGGVDGDRI